jgi:hypothetical protein
MRNPRIEAALKRIDEMEKTIKRNIYRSFVDDGACQLRKWLSAHFDTTQLDVSEFEELSSVVDGVNFNGLFIYSLNPNDARSIYEQNEEWWENSEQKQYLFFADDDISWYCYDSKDHQFWVLDKPSGDKVSSYSTVGELLAGALETAIS